MANTLIIEEWFMSTSFHLLQMLLQYVFWCFFNLFNNGMKKRKNSARSKNGCPKIIYLRSNPLEMKKSFTTPITHTFIYMSYLIQFFLSTKRAWCLTKEHFLSLYPKSKYKKFIYEKRTLSNIQCSTRIAKNS